ncbi:hypothetical protein BDW62DRAFT_41085 [Aspergillus aurantiobrunneus]
MALSFLSFLFFLLLTPFTLSAPPYRYYLKSPSNNLYLSSSMTFNGRTNYVLLTNSSLAQPLTLYEGDGSITLDTSNVIGASSQAPILLADTDGLSNIYKQVVLGDQMSGRYTTGFEIDDESGGLVLNKEGFGGFVACTAARGIKQVYWYQEGEGEQGMPVICEEVVFRREWHLNGTESA